MLLYFAQIELERYIFYIYNEKKYVFSNLWKFEIKACVRKLQIHKLLYKSANHNKDWVRKCKSQICNMPHLQKTHKSNKLVKFANLRVAIFGTLFTGEC
jgi:hypothetical protein